MANDKWLEFKVHKVNDLKLKVSQMLVDLKLVLLLLFNV
jgi:hypothetical protein